jgi:hypothetical protein
VAESGAELILVYGPPGWPLRYTLYPTTTDVLGLQDRAALCCGGAFPAPVSDSVAGEFEALLANVTVAEAVPVDWGVKVSVKEAFWPAASVSGSVIPLTVNSELLEDAEETVTLATLALSVPV